MAISQWKEQTPIHVLIFVSFLISGLFVNLLQLLLFCLVVKIYGNKRLFRSVNYYLIYVIYSQLLFLADWWSGAKLVYHCENEILSSLGKDHAIILMNHHYEIDWLYGWMVGDRAKVLGNCRVYVKKMLKYVPIVGWAWSFSDTVFLERDWIKDQETLKVGLRELQDYPDPVWVLLFPEGTRYTQEKYEAGKQFSESRGLPTLKHCLVPRSKGFTSTVSNVQPQCIPWVYDVTLACLPTPPSTLTSALLGRSTEAHMYIRRFKLSDIPREEKDSARWLQELFQTKDELLGSFKETGKFQTPQLPNYHGVTLPPRLHSILVPMVVNLLVLVPLIYYLLTGGWLALFAGLVGFFMAMAGIKYFLALTQVAQGTSYGKKEK